jgi:hypothetical protein
MCFGLRNQIRHPPGGWLPFTAWGLWLPSRCWLAVILADVSCMAATTLAPPTLPRGYPGVKPSAYPKMFSAIIDP